MRGLCLVICACLAATFGATLGGAAKAAQHNYATAGDWAWEQGQGLLSASTFADDDALFVVCAADRTDYGSFGLALEFGARPVQGLARFFFANGEKMRGRFIGGVFTAHNKHRYDKFRRFLGNFRSSRSVIVQLENGWETRFSLAGVRRALSACP